MQILGIKRRINPLKHSDRKWFFSPNHSLFLNMCDKKLLYCSGQFRSTSWPRTMLTSSCRPTTACSGQIYAPANLSKQAHFYVIFICDNFLIRTATSPRMYKEADALFIKRMV